MFGLATRAPAFVRSENGPEFGCEALLTCISAQGMARR
jgi:hypothetical protein